MIKQIMVLTVGLYLAIVGASMTLVWVDTMLFGGASWR